MATIIKSMSVKQHRISITSSDLKSAPRKYKRHSIDIKNDSQLEQTLYDIGYKAFDGNVRFLPSCSCMAHEAVLLANDAMHMTPAEAKSKYQKTPDVIDMLHDEWTSRFVNQIIKGQHDASKYVLLCDSVPMQVHISTDHEAIVNDVKIVPGKPNFLTREQAMIARDYLNDDKVSIKAI